MIENEAEQRIPEQSKYYGDVIQHCLTYGYDPTMITNASQVDKLGDELDEAELFWSLSTEDCAFRSVDAVRKQFFLEAWAELFH